MTAHARNQRLSIDCHWNHIETYHLWISLNAAWWSFKIPSKYQTKLTTGLVMNTYEHWCKTYQNLVQPRNTLPSRIVASISSIRLSTVRSQPSAMSNDKAAIPKDLAFWPTMPLPANKSKNNFDWPVWCKVWLTSWRYSAEPFFRTGSCAFCFSPLHFFIFFMGLTFWLPEPPLFRPAGLAGCRARFNGGWPNSWHKHILHNEV